MKASRVAAGAVRTLRTLAALRGVARRRYLAAWWALLACRLRLRFPRWLAGKALLERALADRRPPGPCAPSAAALQSFRQALSDHPLDFSCCPRALALWRFLDGQGCATRLEMGLRRDAAGLSGHIWVMHGDQIVADSPELISTLRVLRRDVQAESALGREVI